MVRDDRSLLTATEILENSRLCLLVLSSLDFD